MGGHLPGCSQQHGQRCRQAEEDVAVRGGGGGGREIGGPQAEEQRRDPGPEGALQEPVQRWWQGSGRGGKRKLVLGPFPGRSPFLCVPVGGSVPRKKPSKCSSSPVVKESGSLLVGGPSTLARR